MVSLLPTATLCYMASALYVCVWYRTTVCHPHNYSTELKGPAYALLWKEKGILIQNELWANRLLRSDLNCI